MLAAIWSRIHTGSGTPAINGFSFWRNTTWHHTVVANHLTSNQTCQSVLKRWNSNITVYIPACIAAMGRRLKRFNFRSRTGHTPRPWWSSDHVHGTPSAHRRSPRRSDWRCTLVRRSSKPGGGWQIGDPLDVAIHNAWIYNNTAAMLPDFPNCSTARGPNHRMCMRNCVKTNLFC